VQNTTAAPKKAKSKQQSTAGSFNIYSLNAWRWPIGAETCSGKHVYNCFIRILISFDELCYTKDCIIKKVIEKRVTGCRGTILWHWNTLHYKRWDQEGMKW
jgi:hypothetical protein